MFLFFQFHLHLLHLFTNAFIRAHSVTLPQKFCAEKQEQDRGKEMGEAFGKKGGHGMAQHGGQNGHRDESGKGRGEND